MHVYIHEMITQMELVRRLLGRVEPVDWDAVCTIELPRVFNYFRYHGLADAEAEDLTAATFEKVWRARNTYRSDKAGVSTWLMTIAQHTAVDYFRARLPELSLDALDDHHSELVGGPEPEETVQQHEEMEHLRRLLAGMPERERELIALKYGAEMTNRAIAKLTGLSESNVGTIFYRVITTLRAQLEHER